MNSTNEWAGSLGNAIKENDRLRAVLAQVGQATKRACYDAVDGARWDSDAERQALGRACALILAVDDAAIVAASADTCTCELHKGNHSECRKAAGMFVCCCARVGGEAAVEGRERDDERN